MKDRMLREKDLLDITGISIYTIKRLQKQNRFPKRYKLSDGIHGYKEPEIEEWINSCPIEVTDE